MRVSELKKYKPLDITQISGSPWNTAEKVLGLDENKDVVMAKPEGVVTPEDVTSAITEAMEVETARTEAVYAKIEDIPEDYATEAYVDRAITAATQDLASKEYVDEAISGVTVDLSDYYTKEEVDAAISGVTVDLSDYYTKEEVDTLVAQVDVREQLENYALTTAVTQDIQTAIASETARTESTYAKPSDIPSLTGYATENYVDNAITAATEDMATTGYVADAIAAIPSVDLSPYAKTTAVTEDIQTAIASETARTEATYAKVGDIPSLDGYATEAYVTAATQDMATKTWVGEQGYLTEHQSLEDYYTKEQVDAEITGATEGMATTGWVESQGYLTEHQDLSAYAPTTAVTEDIQSAIAAETARTEQTYAKPSDIPSLTGYSTTEEMNDAITAATATTTGWVASQNYLTQHQSLAGLFDDVEYVSSSKTINFYDQGDNLVGQVDATDFIKDGMVDNVYITGSTLVISFNTDAGQEDIEIALTDIFNPANYYDKTAIDVLFASETARTENTYLKEHQDLSDYALTTAVTADIATAMAAETGRTEQTYAKIADIPSLDGYWTSAQTETYVDNAICAVTTDAPTKAWVTGDTETRIETAMAAETARTENVYAKPGDIPSLDGYATQAWVTGDTEDRIETAISGETARTESTYAKIGDIPSLSGYATESYVDAAITSATEDFVTFVDLTGITGQQVALVVGEESDNVYILVQKIGTSSEDEKYVNQTQIPGIYVVSLDSSSIWGKPWTFYINHISVGEAIYTLQNTVGNVSVEEGLTSTIAEEDGTGVWAVLDGSSTLKMVLDTIHNVVSFMTVPSYEENTPGILDQYALTTSVTADIQTAMASETARTESVYAKPGDIPSLSGYATEAYVDESVTAATATTTGWVASQGYLTEHQDLSDYAKTTAVTADIATAMASETARTEETYATLEDVYGVTASTQMEITTADTNYICRIGGVGIGELYDITFKETNIPGYYAIRLLDTFSEYTGEMIDIMYVRTSDNSVYVKYPESYTASTETLGTYIQLSAYGSYVYYIPYSLDNTYDYYLVFKPEENKLGIFKTLPVVDVITKTVPAYEDVPVAQDGSSKKVFVYDFGTGGDGSKRVISGVRIGALKEPSRPNRQGMQCLYKFWNNNEELSWGAYVNIGTNKTAGFKADYDSETLFAAEDALLGFTEQITLTPTGQSANDSIYGMLAGYSYSHIYFQETNNPRYEVLPCSAITNANMYIQYFYIGGTSSSNRYYAQEYDGGGNQNPLLVPGVKGKLGKNSVGTSPYVASIANTNNYIILDKETLQYEIATSLTITRAKNLQSTIGNIETLLANI